jgi:hypothetical protein
VTAPIRIQRKRTKGYKMPPNTASVARPGKWGNPFKIAPGFESEGVKFPEITAESAVALYREWIERALQNWPSTGDALAELRGKNLACFCALDKPCHADVLLKLANKPICEAA